MGLKAGSRDSYFMAFGRAKELVPGMTYPENISGPRGNTTGKEEGSGARCRSP